MDAEKVIGYTDLHAVIFIVNVCTVFDQTWRVMHVEMRECVNVTEAIKH